MPWSWPWSSSSPSGQHHDPSSRTSSSSSLPSLFSTSSSSSSTSPPSDASSTWQAFLSPRALVPAAIMTSVALSGRFIWARYLRRIRVAGRVPPSFWRRRSVFGRVTSVGDGDGLRIFHTPGGRLAGWGWLPGRTVPTRPKELKDQTISIRLAGVDAPEMAHFGHPAQPGSQEAYDYLTQLVQGRRVRAHLLKRDQYERAVATVYVRRPPFFGRTDVGLDLLRQGLATVYEGKTGAEFGGEAKEREYRAMEDTAKRAKRGIWKTNKSWGAVLGFAKDKAEPKESPMQYKKRMAREGGEESSGQG